MQIEERLIRRYAAGEQVFAEGDAGREMFVVVDGEVGIYRRGAGGAQAIVGVAGPGDIFGEMALVEALPRTASVRAMPGGVSLVPIDHARFVYLLTHQPAFALNVMQAISQRVRDSRGIAATAPANEAAAVRSGEDAGRRGPHVNELRPGIFQFVLPQRGSHVYLVRGRSRNVLIDTGLQQTIGALEEGLATLGLAAGDIDLVILTHEHIDHAGGAPRFAGHSMIAAHRLAANKVTTQDDFALMTQAFGASAADFRVDIHFEDGAVIDLGTHELNIIHTPGHTSGGVCLYEPGQRLLFSGDMMFAGGIMGGVFGSGNISDYIGSLKQLRNLRLDAILPGHGRVCTDPYGDLDRAILLAGHLLADSKDLLAALNLRASFDQVLRAAFGK